MNSSFEHITYLQYRLKVVERELAAFKSGEKYVQMKAAHQKEIRFLERMIKKLKEELSAAHSEIVTVRDLWFEVFEDIQKEEARRQAASDKEKEQLRERAIKAERQLDKALDKVSEQRHRIYELESRLEKEEGKNLRLRAMINRDHENSFIPSSKMVRHKKISNSREKTGRRPGGQPGHKGHGRKKQAPTQAPFLLPPPQEVLDDPDFKKTSKTIIKQLVNVRMVLDVTEYHAEVYRNSKTGERIHAAFPPGVIDDINYGGSIRAFLFLLNNDCCISIDKSRRFLSDLTGGKLNISKGMINKLSREFAAKTKTERKAIFSELLMSPVMHIDCTNARVNGKSAYVFVCAGPDGRALYSSCEKKGHEGVKGTVAEDYEGILVHDHEKTFSSYGKAHQECLAHVLRYLKDSIENEPERTWNREMRSLIQEMIHYRNSLPLEVEPDAEAVSKLEERYKKVLQKAKEEYEYVPPGDYYRDGYNLYRRMEEYMQAHLLFLHDHRVPATNNEAERLLRIYKRKQQQAVTFRSYDSIDHLCQCMSMLIGMRQKGEANIFDRVSQIFG